MLYNILSHFYSIFFDSAEFYSYLCTEPKHNLFYLKIFYL